MNVLELVQDARNKKDEKVKKVSFHRRKELKDYYYRLKGMNPVQDLYDHATKRVCGMLAYYSDGTPTSQCISLNHIYTVMYRI